MGSPKVGDAEGGAPPSSCSRSSSASPGASAPRGGTPIDVRFLSATHRDLEAEVRHDRFPRRLYYRINGLTIRIPPLRERRDEIDGLIAQFASEAADQPGRDATLTRAGTGSWYRCGHLLSGREATPVAATPDRGTIGSSNRLVSCTARASRMRLTRSTVMPWYSFLSSRDTCDS